MGKTRVIRVDPKGEAPEAERVIAAAVLRGAVIAYPTETFYALGAAAFSKRAVERIYRLKGRDAGKPLPVVAADLEMVKEIAGPLPPEFRALAGEFWPGPLTLVLPASERLPEHLLGPGRTIAVRVPPPAWLRRLVRDIAQPLTATSANLTGGRELSDPDEVEALFGGRVDLVVDGGPAPGGAPSTIVDLTAAAPRILREGAVPAARVRAVLGG